MSSKFNFDVIDEIAKKNVEIKNESKQINESNNPITPINDASELNLNSINTIDDATKFIKEQDMKITRAWFNLAHALKKVRDEKLYLDKYQNFKEYYTNELSYKEVMVYNFLKIAETYLLETEDDIVELGVTKLIELAKVDEEKRKEIIENNNIKEMSVNDTRKIIRIAKSVTVGNHGAKFHIPIEDHITFRRLHEDMNVFYKIIETVAMNDMEDTELTHDQVICLNQFYEKTKKDMLKLEKIIKKYY